MACVQTTKYEFGGGVTQQEVRDAMELSSTGGEDAIDDKLNRTYNAAVAGL